MNFKKGALITKLSNNCLVYKPHKTTNEIGSDNTIYSIDPLFPRLYITEDINSGQRSDIANKYGETATYTAQAQYLKEDTGQLYTRIQINDIIKEFSDDFQTVKNYYRVIEIDIKAANVNIEAEFKLIKIDDLQDKLID